jgi:hypothetical protein
MLNTINELCAILRNNSTSYNESVEIITIKQNGILNFKAKLNEINIAFTEIQDQQIQIDTNQLTFKFYWTDKEFKSKISTVSDFNTKNYLVLNLINNKERVFIAGSKQEFVDITRNKSWFIQNTFAYLELLEKLKDKANPSFDFHFIDNFDNSSDRFLITSPKEPGKLLIQVPDETIDLDETIDYKLELSFFDSVFEPNNKNLPIFLKTEFYSQLKGIDENQRLAYLIIKFRNIYNVAQKNFEVYLNDISIDDLKKGYDDYKKKYFELVSDVIGKITNQFIALPITVATAAFAIIRVEDSIFASILIITALLGASFYLSFMLRIYKKDIDYFSIIITKDYNRLLSSKFFTKYPDEIEDFNFIKENLLSKINSYRKLISLYFILMWIFNMLLLYLLLYIQLKSLFSLLLFVAITVFINATLYYQFLIKK